MASYLITGATSGLGLQAALHLTRRGGADLIAPVRDSGRGAALRQALAAAGTVRVTTPIMDLASLHSVADFLDTRDQLPALDGVLLNAGVQSGTRLAFSAEGYETTFALNHLAHHLLLQGLLASLAPQSIVVWTASGTHDPRELSARLSGYRGAQYTSLAQVAAGDYGTSTSAAQACRDAYATSKLCNIVSARLFADTHGQRAMFYAFDPGLMPGTGLARDFPRAAQWVWNTVLPRLAAVMPGTSTPQRSARLLTAILTGELRGRGNGAYFNYSGKQVEPAVAATDGRIQRDLAEGSARLLQAFQRTHDTL